MIRLALAFLPAAPLLCAMAVAQLATASGQGFLELPGPPKNPPIFSMMTMASEGQLEYQDQFDLKGSVAQVVREDSQTIEENPDPFHRKIILTFDKQQHLTERVDEDPMGRAITDFKWINGRLASKDSKRQRHDGKPPSANEWSKLSYDGKGRLSEIRAGRGDTQSKWFTNFRYDGQGRLLGYENKAEYLVEMSYSANTITQTNLKEYNRQKFFEQVQLVDGKKRVIDLKVSDMSGGNLNPWYHVAFQYDDEGRVVEQDTDPFKVGDGDDYSPLPGKLSVTYDDGKHLGEQKYYNLDGKLVFHTRFEYDADGIPIKFHIVDATGRDQIGSEMFIDSTRKSTIRPGDIEWEVLYDDHGNWTERRRWFTPADGSPRIMTRIVKQVITYR